MANDDLTDKARELRKNMTNAETKIWSHLRDRRLNDIKFRRQQPIGNYIVDFVSFDKNLIIEIDGGQHSEQEDYDQKRTSWLEEQGFSVLRFWNHEVLTDTEEVLEEIHRQINS